MMRWFKLTVQISFFFFFIPGCARTNEYPTAAFSMGFAGKGKVA